MRPFVTLAALVLMVATPVSGAQILVVSESAAGACYRNAVFDRYDRDSIRDCDIALDRELLGRKDRAATYVNRGILMMRRGELDAAMRDFDSAERVDNRVASAIAVNRSAVFIRLGQFSAALAQTDIAIEAGDYNAADAWFNRGIVLEEQGDISGAYAAYQTALELRPDWAAPRRELERFTVQSAS